MQTITYHCDICGIECFVKDGLGTFAGFIVKINQDLKAERIGFEGHYCAIDSEFIFKEISRLKNAKYNNTAEVVKSSD